MLVTLARSGHLAPNTSQQFAVCFEGRLSRELHEAGARVDVLGDVRLSRPSTVARARRSLSEVLERQHFDLVICHMPWTLAIFGKPIKAAKQRVGLWAHALHDGKHWMERLARTAPDIAIANSRYTEAGLARWFPDIQRGVVYPPVALDSFPQSSSSSSTLRRELGADDATTVIIQVSRMESGKGQITHLKALGQLKDLPSRWTCWMVGGAQRPEEQQYIDELRLLAGELGLTDRVLFLGQRGDVRELLRAADIFCQPNETPDSFGISYIEAMWAGLPVVTSAIGGALEIVDESCGFLAPAGDIAGFADRLRRLIENPDLRAALTAKSKERALELCNPATQIKLLSDISRGSTAC